MASVPLITQRRILLEIFLQHRVRAADHRAELPGPEFATAPADPALSVKDRASRVNLNRQRNSHHHGREQNQAAYRQGQIDDSFDELPAGQKNLLTDFEAEHPAE